MASTSIIDTFNKSLLYYITTNCYEKNLKRQNFTSAHIIFKIILKIIHLSKFYSHHVVVFLNVIQMLYKLAIIHVFRCNM